MPKAGSGSVTRQGLPHPDHASSVLKALTILEEIVWQKRPVATAELASTLGLKKPTAHRIAVYLEKENFLQREPGTRRFIGGPRLVDLAVGALEASTRQGPRHAILQALSANIGETCNLGVLAGNEIIYLDRVESQWPLGLRFEAGSRVPLHCTAIGKLLLGYLPERQRRQLIRVVPLKAFTANTITDLGELEGELEEIRRQGFAIDNEEFLAGVVCAAVPVAVPEGRRYTGLAVSAPAARMGTDAARAHIPALTRAAERLSATFADDDVADAQLERESQACP